MTTTTLPTRTEIAEIRRQAEYLGRTAETLARVLADEQSIEDAGVDPTALDALRRNYAGRAARSFEALAEAHAEIADRCEEVDPAKYGESIRSDRRSAAEALAAAALLVG